MLRLLTPLLADTLCAGPAAGCKKELATGISVVLWIMALAAFVFAGWKLMFMPMVELQDTMEAEVAQRRGLWNRLIRSLVSLLLVILLLGLIFAMAQSRIQSWAEA